ncbi:hypothetical protein DFH06DRAFT_1301346 [Mycena polygramma]|nr:hypothetical protein DFH06DRAFT_1301346 [Mycena polygramma]
MPRTRRSYRLSRAAVYIRRAAAAPKLQPQQVSAIVASPLSVSSRTEPATSPNQLLSRRQQVSPLCYLASVRPVPDPSPPVFFPALHLLFVWRRFFRCNKCILYSPILRLQPLHVEHGMLVSGSVEKTKPTTIWENFALRNRIYRRSSNQHTNWTQVPSLKKLVQLKPDPFTPQCPQFSERPRYPQESSTVNMVGLLCNQNLGPSVRGGNCFCVGSSFDLGLGYRDAGSIFLDRLKERPTRDIQPSYYELPLWCVRIQKVPNNVQLVPWNTGGLNPRWSFSHDFGENRKATSSDLSAVQWAMWEVAGGNGSRGEASCEA